MKDDIDPLPDTGHRKKTVWKKNLSVASSFFLIFLLILTISLDGHARGPGSFSGGRGPGIMGSQFLSQPDLNELMAELTEKLQLNDGQSAEIRPVLLGLFNEQKELHQTMMENTNQENRQTVKNQMQALRQEAVDRVADFLSEEQLSGFQKALEEIMQNNRSASRSPGGGFGFRGGGRGSF